MTIHPFFEEMLSDFIDKSPMPLDARTDGSPGSVDLLIPLQGICKDLSVDAESAACSVFAYALSRFIGSHDVEFTFRSGDRMFPIRIDCSDRPCGEYVRMVSEIVSNALNTGCTFSEEDFEALDLGVDVVFGKGAMNERTNLCFCHDGDAARLSHSSKISGSTAKRFLEVCRRIAESIVKAPRLSDIQYTCEEDLARMDSLNCEYADIPYENLSRMFEAKVKEDPDHMFLRYLDMSMTYSDAERVTHACASNLMDAGIGKGDRVAIAITKSEWYLLAPLSIIRAGGCYLSIDHRYPDEMAAMMLMETRAKAVLVDGSTEPRISPIASKMGIKVLRISDMGTCDDLRDLPMDAEPDSPAYIQYTSGTTGVPKGAVITHFNILNTMVTNEKYTGFDPNDVFAIASTPSFLAFHMEFWGNVYGRMCNVIVPDDVRYDIPSLNRFYSEYGVTSAFLITPLAKIYVSNVPSSPLRILTIGGDSTGHFDFDLDIQLREGYGCTEYGAIAFTEIKKRCDTTSVGRIYTNTAIYILDDEGRRVPYGAVGTLYISGRSLTKGYINRDELNAALFSDNPFDSGPGYERMFRIGDTARLLPDGTLAILGRKDGQVKIRGFRVEVTEVEAAIRRCKEVVDVCVTAPKLAGNSRSLVAYVVGRRQFTQEEIADIVRESKGEHLVPSYVVNMERLPLGRTGKIDRASLPLPEVKGSGGTPAKGLEGMLCGYMSKVLEVQGFGPEDDFILMGGDSLRAARVVILSSEDASWPKDRRLKSADIMKHRTPRAIVSHLDAGGAVERIFDLEGGCVMPDQMLNFYLSSTEDKNFLLTFAITSEEWTDGKRLEAAVGELLRAHPVLRSRAVKLDGVPWLMFDAEVPILHSDEDVFEEGLKDPAPLDVLSGAMCRFTVCSGGGSYGLLVEISHTIMDGYSIDPFVKALRDAYDGQTLEVDTGILDCATHSATVRKSERYARSREMFLKEVEGRDLTFSIIPKHPDAVFEPGLHNNLAVELEVSREKVERTAESFGVSPGMLLSSAFGIAMARYSGRKTSLFAQVHDGRGTLGQERALGNYASTVPFYTNISEDMDIAQYVRSRSDHVYELISNDSFPVWELFRAVGKPYSNMQFQYYPYSDLVEGNVRGCGIIGYTKVPMSSFINVELVPKDGSYLAATLFMPEYDRKDVEDLLRIFDRTVADMCERTRLSEL